MDGLPAMRTIHLAQPQSGYEYYNSGIKISGYAQLPNRFVN
jgi:hypothetical protein